MHVELYIMHSNEMVTSKLELTTLMEIIQAPLGQETR